MRSLAVLRWPVLLIAGALGAIAVGQMRLWLFAVWHVGNGDVREYYLYAQAFVQSHAQYRPLPAEYPPLALAPFCLTLLFPGQDFQMVFSYAMGVVLFLGYLAVARYVSAWRALVYCVYLIAGVAATIYDRYDLAPALLTLLALFAIQRRHFTLAAIMLALGVLLKLYPALLIPVLALAQWRALHQDPAAEAAQVAGGRDRPAHPAVRALIRLRDSLGRMKALRVASTVALSLLVVVVGLYSATLINPKDTFSFVTFAQLRPIQAESTPASIVWLLSIIGHGRAQLMWQFNSLALTSDARSPGVILTLANVALVLGCLWTYWRQARGKISAGQAFVACIAILIVTNKVFSPQYLIWLLPLVAAVEGFDLVWLAICILTTLDFPVFFRTYVLVTPHPNLSVAWPFMLDLALRNGLLVIATLRVLRNTEGKAARSPARFTGAERSAPVRKIAAEGPESRAVIG